MTERSGQEEDIGSNRDEKSPREEQPVTQESSPAVARAEVLWECLSSVLRAARSMKSGQRSDVYCLPS